MGRYYAEDLFTGLEFDKIYKNVDRVTQEIFSCSNNTNKLNIIKANNLEDLCSKIINCNTKIQINDIVQRRFEELYILN